MTIAIGFSIGAAIILVLVYLVGQWIPKRSAFSILACVALSATLVLIQTAHLNYLQGGPAPLDGIGYRLCLFLAPALFFYFGRALVLPDAPVRWPLLWHLLPPALAWGLPGSWGLTLVLVFGTGYALWLSYLVLAARGSYRQRHFERALSTAITLFAVLVLISGVLLTRSPDRFYTIYGLSISATYAMIVFALVAIPDFVNDLFERTAQRYTTSTLGSVEVTEKLKALDRLMREEHLYRDETLSLTSLAEAVDLSHHKLSELINQHLNQSYSQYVRSHRLREASALLRADPAQSVLSIALATGFRSQSTFYTAFRDEYGCTPSAYRKAHANSAQ